MVLFVMSSRTHPGSPCLRLSRGLGTPTGTSWHLQPRPAARARAVLGLFPLPAHLSPVPRALAGGAAIAPLPLTALSVGICARKHAGKQDVVFSGREHMCSLLSGKVALRAQRVTGSPECVKLVTWRAGGLYLILYA